MDIYTKKQRWKIYLLGFAAAIVGLSLYYTNIIVNKIAEDELQKVRIWADAVQNRANLVLVTEQFFEEMRTEDRKRVTLWAEATRRFIEDEGGDISFYARIIVENTTIPVLLVNSQNVIASHLNLTETGDDSVQLEGQPFEGEIREQFSVYEPIPIAYEGQVDYLYYQDSWLFTNMRKVMDDLIDSFLSEVVINSANVPVIITDSAKTRIIAAGNIGNGDLDDSTYVQQTIDAMADRNQPLVIELPLHGTCHVFYTHSFLLTQLRYYPVAQFLAIGIFLLAAYILFSTARNAEQNQVWVGMSKETAHQLGTPISSLIAWVELLKGQGVDETTIKEIQKDVGRLENITERFSKIGSAPKLTPYPIADAVKESIDYMKTRTTKKVNFFLNDHTEENPAVPLNLNLFGWVLENICKNAVDAMSGNGTITVDIYKNTRKVYIDITDTGKGIPKGKFKDIFQPGYTSKKRGWGLGLSLSRRIIENYHRGKIFVKSSSPEGTTFRIALKI
ncbi:MAG: HAMP domain-containing histidine kinase [Bacteroidales bacterium]|nr:HAMP domain-containing histidine kinase [Bacteroidales bacterium]